MVIPILQMLKVKKSFLFQSQDLVPALFIFKGQAMSFEMRNDQGEEMDDTHRRLSKNLNKAPAVPWSSSK